MLDKTLPVSKIHLADSNKKAKILEDIARLAQQRNINLEYKSKLELSRISKSSKQDQGVAADIQLPNLYDLDDLDAESLKGSSKLILLDGVTNPQNLGMIIRSVAASGIGGLILPSSGCADLGPLAIKASVGTVFKCPIFRCHKTKQAIEKIQQLNGKLFALSLDAKVNLGDETKASTLNVYVLGNESDGVSAQTQDACDELIKIPMHNGVESLNVAVTAALIAFDS